MTGAAPYVGDILIRDGRIVQIGTSLQEMPEEETIDASGLWALPGFVDAHTHQGGFDMIDQNGMDLNEMTDPITPQGGIGRGYDAVCYTGKRKRNLRTGVCHEKRGKRYS